MQSRRMSLFEATTSTAIGFAVSLITQFVAFPLVGIHGATMTQNLQLTCIFTVVSIARSYVVRRIFNRAPLKRSPA